MVTNIAGAVNIGEGQGAFPADRKSRAKGITRDQEVVR